MMGVMVAQQCECIQYHQATHLKINKMATFILCVFEREMEHKALTPALEGTLIRNRSGFTGNNSNFKLLYLIAALSAQLWSVIHSLASISKLGFIAWLQALLILARGF